MLLAVHANFTFTYAAYHQELLKHSTHDRQPRLIMCIHIVAADASASTSSSPGESEHHSYSPCLAISLTQTAACTCVKDWFLFMSAKNISGLFWSCLVSLADLQHHPDVRRAECYSMLAHFSLLSYIVFAVRCNLFSLPSLMQCA